MGFVVQKFEQKKSELIKNLIPASDLVGILFSNPFIQKKNPEKNKYPLGRAWKDLEGFVLPGIGTKEVMYSIVQAVGDFSPNLKFIIT